MLRAVTVSEAKIKDGEVQDTEGRTFEGYLVASVEKSGEKAPIYAAFVISEGQYGPFWANLRTGAEISLYEMTESADNNHYSRRNDTLTICFPAKESLVWSPRQRAQGGCLLQVYNPRWFNFSYAGGKVDVRVEVCAMPRLDRLAVEQEALERNRPSVLKHIAVLASMYEESQEVRERSYGYSYKATRDGFDEQAEYCEPFTLLKNKIAKEPKAAEKVMDCLEARSTLIAALLMQRSGLPMPEDPRFFAQLYLLMRAKGLLLVGCNSTAIVRGVGEPDVGLSEPMFVDVTTDKLREFLAVNVRFFEQAISSKGLLAVEHEMNLAKMMPDMDDDDDSCE